MAYKQTKNPFPVTSCGRRRTFTQGGTPGNDRKKTSRFKKSSIKIKRKKLFYGAGKDIDSLYISFDQTLTINVTGQNCRKFYRGV